MAYLLFWAFFPLVLTGSALWFGIAYTEKKERMNWHYENFDDSKTIKVQEDEEIIIKIERK